MSRGVACRGFRTIKCLDDFMTVCLWHNSTWYNSNPKVPKMNDAKQFRDSLSESITAHDAPDEAIFNEMYSSVCKTAFPQVRPPPPPHSPKPQATPPGCAQCSHMIYAALPAPLSMGNVGLTA